MQQPRSGNRALIFGLLALLLLLVVGGGLFLLLQPAPQPVSNPGPSGPDITQVITPTPNTTNTTQTSPVKADAGDTVVTLTWQPVGDATGYFVHRDGDRDPLNVKPIAETSYMDIGLTNGRVYTYTVAPVIGGIEGSSLPPVHVAPIAPR
jgi:hypothetical protein